VDLYDRLTVEMSSIFIDNGYHKLLQVGAEALLNLMHPELDVSLRRRCANPHKQLAQRNPRN
jgi:hypothetical protein